MKFGQITNSHKKYSTDIDYLQFDICGLSTIDAVNKLNETLDKNPHVSKIILHSDWTKKGCSENNLPTRIYDYIDIHSELSKYIDIIGITLHPMFKNKISLSNFLELVDRLEEHMSVFIENRSNSRILISTPQEIINLSESRKMTIDIPQLLISCNYNYDLFKTTLSKINWDNVKEIHIANIKRDGNRTYVGRSLNDGIININDITPFLNKKYLTLEILGGVKIFEANVNIINKSL